MNGKLHVLSHTLGSMDTNSYIVWEEESKEAVIIDPADAGEYLSQQILSEGLELKKIIATHGHFDHILAATHLQLAFDVPFLISKKDEFLVDRMRESAKHFLGRDPGPKPIINEYLSAEQELKLGDLVMEVIKTPGHTPGGLTFLIKNSCFVGDCLFFAGGVGRTDFKYSDPEKLDGSINRILKLPGETVIYSGHGPASLVEKEKEVRGFGNN